MVTKTQKSIIAVREACAVTGTLAMIEGKWKPCILYYLTSSKKRFGELAAWLLQFSRKVLTDKLKQRESDALIIRQQYNQISPKVEYSLTEMSNSLSLVFAETERWGACRW